MNCKIRTSSSEICPTCSSGHSGWFSFATMCTSRSFAKCQSAHSVRKNSRPVSVSAAFAAFKKKQRPFGHCFCVVEITENCVSRYSACVGLLTCAFRRNFPPTSPFGLLSLPLQKFNDPLSQSARQQTKGSFAFTATHRPIQDRRVCGIYTRFPCPAPIRARQVLPAESRICHKSSMRVIRL